MSNNQSRNLSDLEILPVTVVGTIVINDDPLEILSSFVDSQPLSPMSATRTMSRDLAILTTPIYAFGKTTLD